MSVAACSVPVAADNWRCARNSCSVFECVINISEGRDAERLAALSSSAGGSLRDLHADRDHHRSVFTLINEESPLLRDVANLARRCVQVLDIREHIGVHPRLGVLDVVPFVALNEHQAHRAVELRDETAHFVAEELRVPCFLYGELPGGGFRTLPEVRRRAFHDLLPDVGPPHPHESAGAAVFGARGLLVAWNIWLEGVDLAATKRIASTVRSHDVRTLGLEVATYTQVSCNLINPLRTRPSEVLDHVASLVPQGAGIVRCELVGLAPRALLALEAESRWEELDLSPGRTIEARIGN